MNISDRLPEVAEKNAAFMNIMTRKSVRRYKDEPVADELVSAIVHAGMSAPSGVNKQPWEFVVVDDKAVLTGLADALPYAKMTAHAPVAIAVCGNKERFLDGVDDVLWVQDLSAAAENILLATHALGLGGVWTCLYPHEDRMEAAKSLLNLGEGIVPFCLIPIGYPETEGCPMDKWKADRVHCNRM